MKKLLLALILPSITWAQFADVVNNHPHSNAINYVHQQGLVEGYSDGTYRPDATINRVEFLKILIEAELPSTQSCRQAYQYNDVDWSAWYSSHIQVASCLGIVEGYPDGSFRPGHTINYAEAAKIINGAFVFEDSPGNPWYNPYINRLKTENATPRSNIQPDDKLTRAEMAEIIYRLKSEEVANFDSPNILLIIADDMGLDATPWHPEIGNRKPKTPNLNALAETGLKFNNVWANPVCSPTRAGILTGKYGIHTGVLGPLGRNDAGINVDEYTLHQHLSAHTNYQSAVIGKWHLSTNQNGSNDNPGLMGVRHYSGMISGGVQAYDDWRKVTNGQSSTSNEYITSVFTDDAIDWVKQQKEPWFLWLAYTAPHTPFHDAPANLINTPIDGTTTGQYLSAIEAMDTEIGRLLNSLPQDVHNNTIIIFMGDNGSPGQVAQAPYSRQQAKGTVYNGGINVPFIVSGPGITPDTKETLINTTDLFATIGELSGAPVNNHENSVSFAPILYGQNIAERTHIYSEISSASKNNDGTNSKNGWTIRDQTHKYIKLDSGNEYLFDLERDPFEKNNLINEVNLQEKLSKLKEAGYNFRQN